MLEIKGVSGCKVKVVMVHKIPVLRKSCASPKSKRLILQINKQKKWFNDLAKESYWSVPVVYGIIDYGPFVSCDMELIRGQSFASFLELANFDKLKRLAFEFSEFFKKNLLESSYKDINGSVFIDKSAQVLLQCPGTEYIHQKITELVESKAFKVPIGNTHGDFTLSNMIFLDKGVYLIDFLDVYVESPLLDYVKLEQDIVYHWSLRKIVGKLDIVKIKIALSVLNKEFLNHFKLDESFNDVIYVIRILNWYRILPYADQNDSLYIEEVLKGLLE